MSEPATPIQMKSSLLARLSMLFLALYIFPGLYLVLRFYAPRESSLDGLGQWIALVVGAPLLFVALRALFVSTLCFDPPRLYGRTSGGKQIDWLLRPPDRYRVGERHGVPFVEHETHSSSLRRRVYLRRRDHEVLVSHLVEQGSLLESDQTATGRPAP